MEDFSENKIINNIDNNQKKIEIKQRKRRHSLPLKSFKVTSPAESKILSIICDNIFEDVNIEQNNNLSMIDLGSKLNLKIITDNIYNNEGNINIGKEKKKINSSKTFETKDKNKDTIFDQEDDDLGVRGHKKSYIFSNILKLKMIKAPRLLEEQWKYEKILLDYNIIDFTSKYLFIFIIIFFLFIVTAEMCTTLIKLGDEESFDKIISFLLLGIQNKIDLYIKNPTNHNYFLIKNYIIFFMIITINLKNYPTFIKNIFVGKTHFFHSLVDSIKKLPKAKQRDELLSILNYLFLEEYKELYFRKDEKEKDESLEQIFIEQQLYFSSMSLDITSYDESTYKKIIDILLKFDLSYDNFFKYYQKIKDEDRPEYKLRIAQSIIRVAFSKEKSNYTKEKYYEYTFLKRVIDKDMEETSKKFGDDVKTLFRKEDLCDDVLKYCFFIFCNSMMIESFVKPVKKMLKSVGLNEDCPKPVDDPKKGRDITVEEYNTLFEEINKGLTENIPHVLRILLKLLYNSIKKYFTIQDDNYSPLYTALIFNFIISPRIQMLYSINPLHCNYIRSLNRLMRNTCFNFKFDKVDVLSKFNDSIESNNLKIKQFIKDKIISIKETDDEVKESLNNLFTEKYLIYPKFLFYVDSNLLCGTIHGGEEEIIHFHEIQSTNKKK